ncbi:MAG TPA: head GIN domain-containing protein [Phnomibacter sp.]|nr:head GIN domain-containing protein [Phnomibacter sp.]
MRIFKALVAIVLVTISTGCNFWMDTITGNGHVVTEKRSVAGFKEVCFSGPFDVVIVPGKEYDVSIETDENLLRYVNFDKDGNELEVRILDGVNIRSKAGIKVRISMPVVEAIVFAGSGKLQVEGTIKDIDLLQLSVSGSGNIATDIDCPKVEAEITGSGSIKTQGSCRDLELQITGSGDYEGKDLKSENATVNVTGSGNASVYASMNLDISVTGSGNVTYQGEPSISKKIAGSGKVRSLQQ